MKTIQKINIGQIDLSDETFSVNFSPDLHPLRSSIEQIGLIQPVLLRKKQGGCQIVCGFRRISIFRELGYPEIDASLVGEKEVDDIKLFSISLHDNLTTRGFNTVEIAIALDKLVHHFQIDPNVVIRTYLPLFDLEPVEKILNTYLALAWMEDEIKSYVLKEEVSRSNIRTLSTFTPEDRMALLSLISPLKLGENRLREILIFLGEISKRDHLAIKEIVQRPEMVAILSQEGLTPSQRTERLKKILVDLRYPTLHQKEENFVKWRRSLNLPSPVSLYHAPFFEGKGLKIEFHFETSEEYRTILSFLSHLMDKKEFQEMLQG